MIKYLKICCFFLFLCCTGASLFAQDVLIQKGSVWRYLDTGVDMGTAWREPGFDDHSWPAGLAPLGYGNGDEKTVVSYGPNADQKYPTTYFRRNFFVGNANDFSLLVLKLMVDDGAVNYLNGHEIVRYNMPTGEVLFTSWAVSSISGAAEQSYQQFTVPADYLLDGNNLLAVEVHQSSGSSSDLRFDLSLGKYVESHFTQLVRKAPYLLFTGDPSRMQISWQLYTSTTCRIFWGEDESCSLDSALVSEIGYEHLYRFVINGLAANTKYYYRVAIDTCIYSGSFLTGLPDTASNLDFLVYGDTRSHPEHHDQVARKILDTVLKEPAFRRFVICTGDLVVNGDDESKWDQEFFNPQYQNIQKELATIPFLAVIGNHERSGQAYSRYFVYPFVSNRYYWSFDEGPAHFAILDQYTSYRPGSAPYTWLKQDLASSNKPWKFILLHAPGWTAGGGHGNNKYVQEYIQPLCEQYGVQIVFGGHNHYYARAVVHGVQHITTGGGGAPLYTPDPHAENIVKVSKSYHFCKVKINKELLRFAAVSTTGDTIDTFAIKATSTSVGSKTGDSDKPFQTINIDSFHSFPNPFNSETSIEIRFQGAGNHPPPISAVIYDLFGEKVCPLQQEVQESGYHRFHWDGRNLQGQIVPSGVYFCKIDIGEKHLVTKMLFIK